MSSTIRSLYFSFKSLVLALVLGSLAGSGLAQSWSAVQGGDTPGYGGVVRYMNITSDGSMWMMTEGGGVSRSTNGGASWTSLNSGLGNPFIRSGWIDQGSTPTVTATYKIHAATMGGGVFQSTDGGQNWVAINNGLGCTYVRVFAKIGTRWFAGTDCGTSSGVYYSTDSGASWLIGSGLPTNIRVYSLARINPAAGIDYLLANTDSGIYKSTDNGTSWVPLPSSPTGPNGSRVYGVQYSYSSSASPNLVLMATVEGAGVFTSADEGTSWTASNSGLPPNPVPLSSTSYNSARAEWMIGIDGAGIYKSADRGATWSLFVSTTTLPGVRSIGSGGPPMVAVTYAGPYTSADNGLNWVKGGAGMPGGWTINVQQDSAGVIYAAAADGVYRLSNGAWSRVGHLPVMTGGHVLVRGTTVFATTDTQGVFKLSGDSWQPVNQGLPGNLVYRNPSLRGDSSNPNGYYLGLSGGGVFYTADSGSTWTARNNGLTGDMLNVRYMATAGALVYISTEAGVYKSSDGGQNWAFVFAPKDAANQNLPAGKVVIDSATPTTVYASVSNTTSLGTSIASNGAWKSTDGGVTWTQLAGLAGKKLRDIRMLDATTLFAAAWDDGTAGGVFISQDGGANWVRISTDLPPNRVNSGMALANGGGYAATRGDGLFLFTDPPAGASLSFVTGWNLAGNSNSGSLNVSAVFSDPSKVTTVWKWVPTTTKWAFYAPSMNSGTLATYAAGKGYDVLSTIAAGEGFWVNAAASFSASLPAGAAVTSGSFATTLGTGWSLISIGDNKTPRAFNNTLSLTPPSAGTVAASILTSLWAWNSVETRWFFYAPSLDNSNGLAAYTSSKGYLDFGTTTLAPGVGFWVNKP